MAGDALVGTVRQKTSATSRVATLVAVLVPPLGLLAAIGLLWGVAFHPLDLVLLVALYVASAFGITVGFHRCFTHRSFAAGPGVKVGLGVLGSMAMQGPIVQWATDHRKHHALSDRPGDPHSPHAGREEGRLAALQGFAHAHIGWLFSNLGMEEGRIYGGDLYDDAAIRWGDRLYLLWIAVTFALPFAVGYVVGGTWERAFEALVWGGLLRVFLYQHATFSVNSVCHMFGGRDFRVRDESRNNWLVAILVFGEGWHNNHHAFPASARHGLLRWQLDPSWWVIHGLERLGLAWDVHVPDRAQIARRRRTAGA